MGRFVNPFTDVGFKIVFGQEISKPLLLFTLPDMPEFRTDVVLMDTKTKSMFSDDIKMTFLQLPLFNKEEAECETVFEKWIYIFKNMNILERMPWAAQNAVFNKLSDIVEVAHLSGKTRDEYEASLKRYRDSFDVFETAKEDGLAEGRAEGLAQGITQGAQNAKLETAKRMKSKGFDNSTIAELTQLSLEEINKL